MSEHVHGYRENFPRAEPRFVMRRVAKMVGPLAKRAGRLLQARRERVNPFVELAGLVAAGDSGSTRYEELCLATGLFDRFMASRGSEDCIEKDPSKAVVFAALTGRRDMLLRVVSSSIEAFRRGSIDAQALMRILERAWHVCPDQAADMLAELQAEHPAAVVLAEITGRRIEPALARKLPIASPDANAHLVVANLEPDSEAKLARINRALSVFGQAMVRLKRPEEMLGVRNLAAADRTGLRLADSPRKVSVIMTCFNNATHLRAAMQSVLHQTWPHLELFVVDDASTDGSPEIAEAVGRSDARVRLIRMADNIGTYAAKNAALVQATGEFVAFNDADDWWHPERLERAIRYFRADPSLVAVTGQYFRISDAGHIRSQRLYPLIRWSANSLIFRREAVIERIGYFDENRFGGDSEYVARLRAAFGEGCHHRTQQIQYLGGYREDSLMHGRAFGVDDCGYSQPRRDFEEFWAERLLSALRTGEGVYLPAGMERCERLFADENG